MRRTCYLGVLLWFAGLFTAHGLPVLAADGTGQATAGGQAQGSYFQMQARYDALDAQHSVGFDPPTAAERSASGAGSGAALSDEQANAAELAQKLQNPIASLISVPLQNNYPK